MPSADRYVIGKLDGYLCASVAQVDGHLRALRRKLTVDITAKQWAAVWADVDALLERRRALTTERVPA